MGSKIYYNDNDPKAVAWLRALIEAGELPEGDIDDRSILGVKPDDVRSYTQCHWFAGIGGWPLALKLAGWPDDQPIWTGSPPCQPFSNAGQRKGYEDERHLAPKWLDLISQCKPSSIVGEQVASAASSKRWAWLDDLQDALEAEDYATGAVVLPACSVGAPHIRQRLWFVAQRMGNTEQQGSHWATREEGTREGRLPIISSGKSQTYGWNNVGWAQCESQTARPIEPNIQPLANGISAEVGRLRGYGNAIVPQVGAEVIKAFMDC